MNGGAADSHTMKRERRRLPRRSLGFRLFALILVPVVFGSGLLIDRLNQGFAQTKRVQQLDLLTRETLTSGRLRALFDLERSSAIGIVRGRALPNGLNGLNQLLGIDIEGAQVDLHQMVLDARADYEEVAPPTNEFLSLFEERQGLLGRDSKATINDVDRVYNSLSRLIGDRQVDLNAEIVRLSTAGLGDDQETLVLRDRLMDAQAFNTLVTSLGNQSYLLVTFMADPSSFNDTTKMAYASAILAEREATEHLRLATEVPSLAMSDQSASARQWREAQEKSMIKFGLSVLAAPDLDIIGSARLVGNLGLAASVWLKDATPLFRDLSVSVSASVNKLETLSQKRGQRDLLLATSAGAVALLWVTVISYSLIRPLRKLTKRAAHIRDGEFNDAPIGPIGPREISVLALTFDQLSHNLQLVARQTEALGAGRLQDDALRQPLPGSFGASMQRSIEQSMAMTERLAHQARRDAMTGLPNRVAALERLQEAIDRTARSGKTVTLLFCDLDGFKVVNDTYGHAVGDQVLKEVANRLLGQSRDAEMVARLGGDEFVVIAEGIDNPSDAAAFGQRLIDAVEHPIQMEDARFHLSCSVGVTLSDVDATPTLLLSQADFAVYEAKRSGKAQVMCFDSSMQAAVDDRFALESELREALAEGQLELHIQPIVGADSLTIESAEALLRWSRPGHGLVAPGDFIGVAEESWLIVDIGKFVINEACRLLSTWQAAGIEIPLAVNVAGRHLVDGDLVGDVQRALKTHNTPARLLTIELTESQLVADLPRGAAVLTTLRAIGVRVALDDFGAGYSSLTYLRQLPIDTMKIDRSFVAELPSNSQSGSIVASLQQLAQSLHLEVVAEGVETAEQARFLSDLGCTRLQGYHFARPMPAADFGAWVARDLDRARL
jgi:diguanylate cyclase (GGDEF)-like protein